LAKVKIWILIIDRVNRIVVRENKTLMFEHFGIALNQGFLNWGAAQKICKGGANDLVVVFVMRTYNCIRKLRYADRYCMPPSLAVLLINFLHVCLIWSFYHGVVNR